MTVTPVRGRDPATGSPSGTARWRVIETALESWGGTLRLCLILFVLGGPLSSILYLATAWLSRR